MKAKSEKKVSLFLRIIGTAVLAALPLVAFLLTKESAVLWPVTVLSVIGIIGIDINWYSLSLRYGDAGVVIVKQLAEAQKTADQINVSLDKFNKTVSSFLDTNMAEIEATNRFATGPRPDYLMKFIKSAEEMMVDFGGGDSEQQTLLEGVKANLINSYDAELNVAFPEIAQEAKQYFFDGSVRTDDFSEYNSKRAVVDFDRLRKIDLSSLTWQKQIAYKKMLDKLETFMEHYFN